MSASAPKSTTDTTPDLQLTEEERELLSIRTVPEFEAAQAARRRAKALAKAPESHLATVRRARKINRILGETYPYAVAELDFTNAFELLIATVLSAQTTDVRVNQVTPALFTRYPDAPSPPPPKKRSSPIFNPSDSTAPKRNLSSNSPASSPTTTTEKCPEHSINW